MSEYVILPRLMYQNVNEINAIPEGGTPFIEQYPSAEPCADNVVEEGVTHARNGSIRQLIYPCINTLTEAAGNRFPKLTADHLTRFGATAVLAADALIIADSDRTLLPVILYTAGSLLDAVDGTFARKQHEKNGTEPTSSGMLLDVTADKVQEISTAVALSVVSRRRGDNVAANSYALAAMSAALPALIRSSAESKGLIVGENGLGTRVTRAVLGGVGIRFNKNRAASAAVSTLLVAGSAITSVQRGDVVLRGESSKYRIGTNTDQEFMEAGQTRQKRLQWITGSGLVAGATALKYRPKLVA